MINFCIQTFRGKNFEAAEKRNRIAIAIILLATFVFILALTSFTPYYDDDYNYSDTNTFFELFSKTAAMYTTWSGRLISLFLMRFSLLIPKVCFNILNALVYCELLFVIYGIANRDKPSNAALLIFADMAAWLFYPIFGQTVLWVSGATTYLWLGLIVMAFISYYTKDADNYDKKTDGKKPALKAVVMFIFGFAAGMCNETLSGACMLFCLLYLLYRLIFKLSLNAACYSGAAGVIIGFILQMKAPGNYVRLALLPASSESFFVKYLNRILSVTDMFKELFLAIFIIYAALLFIMIFTGKDIKSLAMALIYGISSFGCVYALILSPYAPERAYFGGAVFFITAASYCFADIFEGKSGVKIACCALSGALTALAFYAAIQAVPDIMLTKIEAGNRETIISAQIENGNVNIIAPFLRDSITDYNAKSVTTSELSGIRELNAHFKNVYTDIETITGIDKNEWNKIYTYTDYDLTNSLYLNDYVEAASGKDYVFIVITVGDIGDIVSEQTSALSGLGCTLDSEIINNSTFLGVYKNGAALSEQVSDSFINVSLSDIGGIENCGITVFVDARDNASCSFKQGSVEYIRRDPGLCIFAYDPQQNRIIDRALFSAGDGSVFK